MDTEQITFKNVDDVHKLETLKVVLQYTIKDHILGKGSYATTYLAINSKDQILACKMIAKAHLIAKINKSSNKQVAKEFFLKSIKNQVQTWKKLKHKNIVRFQDYVETRNNVYFFIQYCSDGTLESVLKQKKFNSIEALSLFKQIVDGCAYLYDMEILHRDLKPENIMLHERRPKITDFGFAKLIDNDHTYVGTPIYMSPQLLTQEPYSIKCDVWSLGVILYRLVCSDLPWKKTANYQCLIQQTKSAIQFPSSVDKNPHLKEIILKMLAVKEEERGSIKEIQLFLKQMETEFQQ